EGLYLPEQGIIAFVRDAPWRGIVKKAVSDGATDPPVALAMDILREGGQCLIFVNTRKNAESLAKRIATTLRSKHDFDHMELAKNIHGETGIAEKLTHCVRHGTAFHHAGLLSEHRKLIETWFRANLIKVIVSTPTLAAGLNLPARRVVIRDYKRYDANYGMTDIPVLEYKQMAGRAGRPGFDAYGEAVLIAKSPSECEALASHYILSDAEDVISKLGTETALRMHVLSTISNGFARTRADLERFFDATFFGYQQKSGLHLLRHVIDRVLTFLENEEMVFDVSGHVKATPFGHLVSRLYVDPLTAVKIRQGLSYSEAVSDISLLHLICSTPDVKRLFMRQKDYHVVTEFVNQHLDEFLEEVPDRFKDVDYDWFLSEVKTAMLVNEWITEASEKEITESYNVGPGDIRNLVDTVQWVSHALAELAAYLKVPARKQARELTARIQFGINKELLDLVQLKNVGRVRGRKLHDAGFTSRKELKNAPFETIAALLGPAVASDVFAQLGEYRGVLDRQEGGDAKFPTDT
ncbi:MAG TPA: helicase-related protein, partial [Candidatus Bathyarchaeia archaeon]|nr:helicase-related protein [Candidatus Bathyarchaeia archaeon]